MPRDKKNKLLGYILEVFSSSIFIVDILDGIGSILTMLSFKIR